METIILKKSEEFLSLAEAAKEFDVSQNYLRFLIFKKKLQGVKMGRNWVTTREWMGEYFLSASPLLQETVVVDAKRLPQEKFDTAFVVSAPTRTSTRPNLNTREVQPLGRSVRVAFRYLRNILVFGIALPSLVFAGFYARNVFVESMHEARRSESHIVENSEELADDGLIKLVMPRDTIVPDVEKILARAWSNASFDLYATVLSDALLVEDPEKPIGYEWAEVIGEPNGFLSRIGNGLFTIGRNIQIFF